MTNFGNVKIPYDFSKLNIKVDFKLESKLSILLINSKDVTDKLRNSGFIRFYTLTYFNVLLGSNYWKIGNTV